MTNCPNHSRNSLWRHARLFALPLLLASVTGCGLGWDNQPSSAMTTAKADVPPTWQGVSPDKDVPADGNAAKPEPNKSASQWWLQLQDDGLNQLVQTALAQNLDVQKAEARLAELTAAQQGAGANLLPQLNGNLGAARSKQAQTTANVLSESVTGSWSLDLFGGNRAKLKAAEAEQASAQAALGDARLRLVASLVSGYIDLRAAQQQQALAQSTIAAQQESWQLTKARRDAGLVSDLDVAQAESQWRSTQAQLPIYRAAETAALHQLELLLGQTPGSLSRLQQAAPPTPPAGQPIPLARGDLILNTPAKVITARPDIQQAQAAVLAALARGDAARAAQFPDLTLSGLFGLQQSSPSSPMQITGNVWSLGGTVLAPLFTFGRTDAEIAAADARTKQADLSYRQAVLSALADVETNLSAFLQEDQRRQTLEQAVASNQLNLELAQQRYRRGLNGFMEVLDAQRRLYETQSAQADATAKSTRNWTRVYQSLGVM
jgi:NodT family efflux transporter outer membrane factor (OMF) lipoprotein